MARVWRAQREESMLFLFSSNTTLGWRVVRRIPKHEGERKVERGVFRRVVDEFTGALLGYQIASRAEQRGDQDLPSLVSTAAISERETRINAGEMGRSHTVGLREPERKEREAAGLLPEDRVERVQAKVMVFAQINGAKGDILRVWPRQSDQRSAVSGQVAKA